LAAKPLKKAGTGWVYHCAAAPLLLTTSGNIWKLRRPAAGPLGEE